MSNRTFLSFWLFFVPVFSALIISAIDMQREISAGNQWNPERIYVRQDANSKGDGQSWQSAFNSLQRALDLAGPRTEIWVAKGTYVSERKVGGKSARNKSFKLKNKALHAGGGGGSQPNFGWAYATSSDGTHFEKQGLIGMGNPTGVEDCHVVFDRASGLYYMYYWYGWDEPEGLYLVTSPTETDFNFNKKIPIRITGDDSYMKKFGHVLRDENGWHMFYSNFVQPHCPNSITRYAFSSDGIHWESKNKRLIKGHDSEVLKVDDDLYLMFSSPQNGFDRADCDIRLSVYNGTLEKLADKAPFFELPADGSLSGKKFTLQFRDTKELSFHFKPEEEVILMEGSERADPYVFNAYYTQDGNQVKINGEGINLTGSYDGNILTLSDTYKSE